MTRIMFQFWKRSSQHDNKVAQCQSYIPEPIVEPLKTLEDEGLFDIDEYETQREHSRLSKTLHEVLSDKSALSYFVEFMEARNAIDYLNCYLDVENYKNEEKHRQETRCRISPLPPITRTEHDSLSVSTDCDSCTADTNSLNSNCDNSDASPKKQTKGVDDALTLFKKYIAQEAVNDVRCPEEIRKDIIKNICDGKLSCCFDCLQTYLYETMDKEFFEAFLASDYFCKHQIDVLTSGNVVLEDILYNETALFYFMEFLEQENNRSLLEFWIAGTNFQQQLHVQKDLFDPIEAQNDAIVLYDKYFSLQAHCPLGFNDKVRFAVEQNICGENGLIPDCFHLPLKIVEKVLERNYLKPFLTSQLFYKYLSELINTVQSSGYAMHLEKDKTSPSDCSSEKSFSTNSTFLALEIPYDRTKNRRTNNMSIDTRQLYDPDALWKRKRKHALSCGRVTELGQFVTDLEPEPDRNGFKLKDVVKKFVSLDEEKKKEEMAWQVAEMIVKDITSVTLRQRDEIPSS